MKRLLARYIGALLIIFGYPLISAISLPLTLYTTYTIASVFGSPALVGNTLQFSSASFTFIPACAAAIAYLLLGALILVTKDIPLSTRMNMFLVGASAIFSMNLLRILGLMYLYIEFGKNYFDAVHLVFWHLISTIFVAIVWIILVEKNKIQSIPVYSDMRDILQKMRT